MFCKIAFVHRLRNKSKRFQPCFILIYNYLLFHDWIQLLSYQENDHNAFPESYHSFCHFAFVPIFSLTG
ncbi:MAG: hypothetical protein EGP87_00920 [Paraprevotella clara]|nr:hypothetical protein [Paraprevotella clara]